MKKQIELIRGGDLDFTLDGKPGREIGAIVNMSNPIQIPERDVGGIHQIEWSPEFNNYFYSNIEGVYNGRRINKQFCVEVNNLKDQIHSYESAMWALLTFGKERFHADAFELTGLMSYLWKSNKSIKGVEGDHIGFASAIFYKKEDKQS